MTSAKLFSRVSSVSLVPYRSIFRVLQQTRARLQFHVMAEVSAGTRGITNGMRGLTAFVFIDRSMPGNKEVQINLRRNVAAPVFPTYTPRRLEKAPHPSVSKLGFRPPGNTGFGVVFNSDTRSV